MKKFQVLADSTSDLEKSKREEYGLDYVPMLFTQDGIEYVADLDWGKINPKIYYDKIKDGSRSITGLASFENIENKFREYLQKGLDILFVACSSALSGTVNNARLVSKDLLKEFPERKIVCFDSLRSCYAQGLMAMDAGKMALQEKTIEETAQYLQDNIFKYQVYATVENLQYLKVAGRVKTGTAFFGDLFGVKPILVSDVKGNNYAFKKVKGRKKSLGELVNIVKSRIINPQSSTVYVEHADCLEDAEYVANKLKDFVKEVNISFVGPVIGATTGPGTILCSFYGQEVDIFSLE